MQLEEPGIKLSLNCILTFQRELSSVYLNCELEICVHGIGCKESGNHCQDSLCYQSLLEV